MENLYVLRFHQKLGQLRLEARAKVVQQHKAAVEDARRHYDIGIDRPVGDSKPACEHLAPAFRLAAGVFVADEECGLDLFKKCLQRGVRRPAHDETHAQFRRVLCHVAQALLKKIVMAEVGAWVIRNDAKVYDHRQVENVGRLDGYVEGEIVRDSHGALHPVDNRAGGLARGTGAAHHNAGLVGQPGEFNGNLIVFEHRADRGLSPETCCKGQLNCSGTGPRKIIMLMAGRAS